MSEPKIAEAPKKRIFAPEPTAERTGLFYKDGPTVTICMHKEYGFHIATYKGRIIWSHQPDLPAIIKTAHPDMLRVVSTWPNDDAATEAIQKVASFDEFEKLAFASLKCDVASAPDISGYAISAGPISQVSIEACARAIGRFPPHPMHKLDPSTRKPNKERTKPTLANI